MIKKQVFPGVLDLTGWIGYGRFMVFLLSLKHSPDHTKTFILFFLNLWVYQSQQLTY